MANKYINPTIYDVAATAHVSIATVSRVLNNQGKVKQETRAAILEAIDALGFIPRAEARARAIKAHRRIGVITPFFTAPSFVQRLRGVAAALQPTPFELVIYTVTSASQLNDYLDTLPLIANLDGLIILSLQLEPRYIKRLIDHHMETVMVEYPSPGLSCVEIDNKNGGTLAANYLHSKGYEKFGFIGDNPVPEFEFHPTSLRLDGFSKELGKLGANLPDSNTLFVQYDMEKLQEHVADFLQNMETPIAIFAASDLHAIAAIQATRQLGLRIPQDVGILGFDDLDMAEYFDLTTIRQHLDESGEVAVEMLLSRLANSGRSVQLTKLPLEIVERNTV